MTYRDPGGRSRWHRLWPKDGPDTALLALGVLGILLSLFHQLGLGGSEFGVAGVVIAPLLALHGSSPVFLFLALALYLSRQGRAIGPHRHWVWIGFVLTIPLWFLVGQPVAIRGFGDATLLLLPYHLIVLVVMGWGVWRTLGHGSAEGPARR